MHLLDEIPRLFGQIGLFIERLSVHSVLEWHEILVRHFRLLIVVLFLLRSHEPSFLGYSF